MLVRFERYPMLRPAWADIADFEHEISSLFGGVIPAVDSMRAPALDLVERDNESVLLVELPGIAKKDIKISLEGDVLTIKGQKKHAGIPDGAKWVRSERSMGEFIRSISLPHPAKAEAVSAELVDGVLRITFPKAEEARPHEISVK